MSTLNDWGESDPSAFARGVPDLESILDCCIFSPRWPSPDFDSWEATTVRKMRNALRPALGKRMRRGNKLNPVDGI